MDELHNFQTQFIIHLPSDKTKNRKYTQNI